MTTPSAGLADIDVAVIGAGAAGIAAARRLRAAGLDCRLLEAADRIGGRAWTECESLGLAFDRGCAWLHDALNNPLRPLAAQAGFTCASGMDDHYHLDGRLADDATRREIRTFLDDSFARLREAGRAGRDVPAARLLDASRRQSPFLEYLLAAINGVDAGEYGTGEAAQDDEGENWFVREGLGALITGPLARGLVVTTGCPVRLLEDTGTAVRLETARGELRARAAIVTVSTGVLAAGGLRLRPALPEWKRRAVEAVPMGRAEKVALRFDRDVFALPENAFVQVRREGGVAGFHLRPFGEPLAVCFTGGSLADEVARLSTADASELALTYLEQAFGSAVRRHLARASVTGWSSNPWTLGAYSAALPGHHALREDLARPLGPRVHFAGEATVGDDFATAHGAWKSGLRAAGAVAGFLSGSPADPVRRRT